MSDQLDLLNENTEFLPEKPTFCRYHRWARPHDFILKELKNKKKKWKCIYCLRVIENNKELKKKLWEAEKENLTDYYVRRMFVMGKGYKLPMEQYPQELVDLKRTILQIKREEESQAERGKEKILLKCLRHGERRESEVVKAGTHRSGQMRYKCKECQKEQHARHYQRHKEEVRKKTQEWRKKNPELRKLQHERYRKNRSLDAIFKEKTRLKKYEELHPERKRLYSKQQIENLSDVYVKRLLIERDKFQKKDINHNLIELKRITVQIKRHILGRIKNDRQQEEN